MNVYSLKKKSYNVHEDTPFISVVQAALVSVPNPQDRETSAGTIY